MLSMPAISQYGKPEVDVSGVICMRASKGNQTTSAENVRLTFALTVLSFFMIFGIEIFFLPFFLDLFLYTLEIN